MNAFSVSKYIKSLVSFLNSLPWLRPIVQEKKKKRFFFIFIHNKKANFCHLTLPLAINFGFNQYI